MTIYTRQWYTKCVIIKKALRLKMKMALPKPKRRSSLRLWLGKNVYTCLRYFLWLMGGISFARQTKKPLEHIIFTHATPLIRPLKDVDMYLQHNKIVNLRIAAKKLDGVTLAPGEVFSFWKTVGKPTRRKGYLEGMVLLNGSFYPGIGGGLCQMSNLIYWLTLHTPLTVLERHRHDYDVFPDVERTQPFGSGATCFYNYGDLMIRNDTPRTYRLQIEVSGQELTGLWQSDLPPGFTYQVYEKEHMIRQEYWGGYSRHNVLFRKKYDMMGDVVDDEYVVENHALMMYPPFLPESSA